LSQTNKSATVSKFEIFSELNKATEMTLLPAGKVPGATPYITEGLGQGAANAQPGKKIR
jgi:hypothetical protein